MCIRVLLAVVFPDYGTFDLETLSADVLGREAARSRKSHALRAIDGEALFAFRDPLVRETIHALKYGRRRELASVFGECLADVIAEECAYEALFGGVVLIVPIPLSRERLFERGFNQSELIAEKMIAQLPEGSAALSDILVRTENTEHQTRMGSRAERFANAHGCFVLDSGANVRGAHIILLDDVITTGATMQEARRVLLDAGARRVSCLAVAH